MNLARTSLFIILMILAQPLCAQTDVQRLELKGPVKYYHYTEDKKGIPDGKGNGYENLSKQYYYFSPSGMTELDSLYYKYKYENWDEWKEWLSAAYYEDYPGGRVSKRLDIPHNIMQDIRIYYKYDKKGKLLQTKLFYIFNDTSRIELDKFSYYPDGKLRSNRNLHGRSDRTLINHYEETYQYEKGKEIKYASFYSDFKFRQGNKYETTYNGDGRKEKTIVTDGKEPLEVHHYIYSDGNTEPPHNTPPSPESGKSPGYYFYVYWDKDKHGNYLKVKNYYPKSTEAIDREIKYYE